MNPSLFREAYDSFKQFLSDHNIGRIVTTTDGDPVIFLESAMVLLKDRYAIDASEGGLVIGNFHFEGGVHILQPFNGGFRYVGEMEGYEFLFSPDATFKYHEQLHQINQSTVNGKDLLPRKIFYSSTYQENRPYPPSISSYYSIRPRVVHSKQSRN